MKSKIYCCIIILLLIINVVVVSVYVIHAKQTKIIIKTLAQYPDQKNAMLNNLYKNISYVGFDLSKDIIVRDTLGNKYNLYNAFLSKNKLTLIVRFSDNYCQSCVKYAIEVIQNVLSENPFLPIIFIGNSEKNSLFAANVDVLGIQEEEVYNCNDLKVGLEYHGFPYYLIVDDKAQIKCCYFPTKHMGGFDTEQVHQLYKVIETE